MQSESILYVAKFIARPNSEIIENALTKFPFWHHRKTELRRLAVSS
jgi:hypothetical protein